MKMNKIIAGTSAAVLSVAVAGVAMAATDSNNIQLNVEVQETLSLDCYDIAGGTGDQIVDMGIVTAGTPVTGASRCNVVTNDDQGYYLTTVNASSAGSTGNVLEHQDANTGTWYSIADQTAWADSTIGGGTGTATWTGTGLAFSVSDFPDDTLTNSTFSNAEAEWGASTTNSNCTSATDTNMRFAGFPDSAQTIAAVTQYEASTTTTDICYKVDVPATQQSGNYSGIVTYTVTTDASTYIQ